MPTLVALYCVDISTYAKDFVIKNKSAIEMSIENALLLPDCKKVLIIINKKDKVAIDSLEQKGQLDERIEVRTLDKVSAYNILSECSKEKNICSDVFLYPLDAPFIDVEESLTLYKRHIKYSAEYSFADGFPQFLLPQILSIGLCEILSRFAKDELCEVSHNFLFELIKKDINSYDIETLVSPEDVRILKLSFIVDSKRALMLCKNFFGINTKNYFEMINSSPLMLKTLPRYYMIEICPNRCYTPIYRPPVVKDAKIMSVEDFNIIIEKISSFSNDAVVSLSLYGDPLEHPQFVEIVKKSLSYNNISLLIETHGNKKEGQDKLEAIKDVSLASPMRASLTPPLYWITAIDATRWETYSKVYNVKEEEAKLLLKTAYETAEKATAIFGSTSYVQIVRMLENEDDLEGFYRNWKERGVDVIIQKYNHFCKALPDRRVADLSPIKRMPCRHINREMCINYNGDVLLCYQDIANKNILGNVLREEMNEIWQRFDAPCVEQANLKFGGLCELCDEYYTYNF